MDNVAFCYSYSHGVPSTTDELGRSDFDAVSLHQGKPSLTMSEVAQKGCHGLSKLNTGLIHIFDTTVLLKLCKISFVTFKYAFKFMSNCHLFPMSKKYSLMAYVYTWSLKFYCY